MANPPKTKRRTFELVGIRKGILTPWSVNSVLEFWYRTGVAFRFERSATEKNVIRLKRSILWILCLTTSTSLHSSAQSNTQFVVSFDEE